MTKRKRKAWNITKWTPEMENFLKENYAIMTNKELADALGLTLTLTRTKCYSLGLYRLKMEYWTGEQIRFLKDNYKQIGDSELAEIFNEKWKKEKGWTKKHIEKKRRYLKLKRSKSERHAIYLRNKANGRWAMCPVKAWEVRGVSEEGTIRVWYPNGHPIKFRKTGKVWIKLAHYNYIQTHGSLPEGMNIIHRDGDSMNCDTSNLEAISNEEIARRNSNSGSHKLSDNWIAGILTYKNKDLRADVLANKSLIELKRNSILLNRTIKRVEQ